MCLWRRAWVGALVVARVRSEGWVLRLFVAVLSALGASGFHPVVVEVSRESAEVGFQSGKLAVSAGRVWPESAELAAGDTPQASKTPGRPP